MAKKGSQEGNYLFFIIVILLIILPLVPFAWAIYAIIKYFQWSKEKKHYPNKTISDFWLSDEEKEDFLNAIDSFWKSKARIEELQNIANNENLARNSNGAISNRSNRGKEINNELNKNINVKNSSFELMELTKEYPVALWEDLKDYFTSYYASSYAFLFWVVGFYYSMKYFFKKPLLAIFEIYDAIFLNRKENFLAIDENWTMDLIFVLSISAIFSILIFYFSKYLASIFIFKTRYKKPPYVTFDNCNKY